MRQPSQQLSRRTVLAAIAAVAALPGVAAPVPAAAPPPLSPDDATAKALGYVHASAIAGQTCGNCTFWQGGDAEWGACPLFPGKSVSASGWCKSWVEKA